MRNLIDSPKVVALAFLGLCVSAVAVADGWHVGAGAVVSFRELGLHVNGKPLSAYEIVYSLHPMDSSGVVEPSGLWIYNFLEVGASGQADNCKKWFSQVATDESQTPHEGGPYPYFELNTQLGYSPIVTDEGAMVIPDGSANCWEAMDFKVPL
jgi:hypothetical protein